MKMPENLRGVLEKASKVLPPVFFSFILAISLTACDNSKTGSPSTTDFKPNGNSTLTIDQETIDQINQSLGD